MSVGIFLHLVCLPILESVARMKIKDVFIFAFSLLASIKKKLPKNFQKLLSIISEVPIRTFS